MECRDRTDRPPRVGERVIRADGPDFVPARVAAVSPSGRMIRLAYEDGGESCAPTAWFLVVPDSYRPPPPRRLGRLQQAELMYDGEIPPGIAEAAARDDAAPAALAARRDEAASWLAWLAQDLYPLDPTRFAEPLARARAALVAATDPADPTIPIVHRDGGKSAGPAAVWPQDRRGAIPGYYDLDQALTRHSVLMGDADRGLA